MQQIMNKSVFVFFALLLSGSAVWDEWQTAQVREVFSGSRSYFVRVTPGEGWGDTVGFKDAKNGSYAKAQFFKQDHDRSYKPGKEITLVNPVAPVEFYVSDSGQLATVDNWHNRGYGKVVVFYSPDGNLIKSYELKDLFSEKEIALFSKSVSSITWNDGNAYIRLDKKTLNISVDRLGKGSSLIFDMATGAYKFCQWQDKTLKSYLCRESNAERHWGAFSEFYS